MLAEYPGYGGRKGNPSEEVFVADASKTIQLIHHQYGNPLYVWGESLGSGVVAAAVSDSLLFVAGIMLITRWNSLPNLAQSLCLTKMLKILKVMVITVLGYVRNQKSSGDWCRLGWFRSNFSPSQTRL